MRVAVGLRRAWSDLPRWAQWVLAVYLIGFAEGTADHVLWMTHGGIHAYAQSYPPIAIQVFFVSLVVLDPVVIALVAFARVEGICLAAAVMALDIAANWTGNWARIRHDWVPTAPWLITLFGVFVLVTALPLLRVMKGSPRPGPSHFIDTVAWVRLENGRILCARPRGKDVFYVPGGKREGTESDLQTLRREITEELSVALLPGTVSHVGTYEAGQRYGDPDGAVVRMSCYTGEYSGTLAASSEIDELAWFSYADRPRVPPVDQLLFDDLKAAGELR